MSQTRKIRRKSGLSKKEQERLNERKKKNEESITTKISRIAILIVLAGTVISLAYAVVTLASGV